MKRTFLILSMLMTLTQATFAEQSDIFLEFHRKSDIGKDTEINRSKFFVPIDVLYDSDTHTIIVIGSESLNAEVYVHDSTGTQVFYSASLNTNYTFSTPGTYTIQIQGDGWYAKGEIEV